MIGPVQKKPRSMSAIPLPSSSAATGFGRTT